MLVEISFSSLRVREFVEHGIFMFGDIRAMLRGILDEGCNQRFLVIEEVVLEEVRFLKC